MPTFQRTLSRDVSDYLAVAGDVEQFCAANSLPTALTFKVCLVLEELVMNQIRHAVSPATDRIHLDLDVSPGRVVLALEDDAAPFDLRSAPEFDKAKPLDQRGTGGMGIHLVRSMAQSIAYEGVDGRNRLCVVIAG